MNLDTLVDLLVCAETAVTKGDAATASKTIVGFAELVFQTAPFRAPGDMPANWKDALREWMEGRPASDVVRICGDDGVDFLQDALIYRLPWAMEAVRVHAAAVGQESAVQLQGFAALAVEVGSANRSVITLLRSGLSSREAAMTAVETTGGSFIDRNGMMEWLSSDEVKERSTKEDWPTAPSRHAWLQFYQKEIRGDRREWRREIRRLRVEWLGDAPISGTRVVLEWNENGIGGFILSPDFVKLGSFRSSLDRLHQYVVDAYVDDEKEFINIEIFGPKMPYRGSGVK